MILAIDTSTSAISVALVDRFAVVATRSRIDARGHTEHLSPLIADLLGETDLTPTDLSAIVVGNGPGPFTGLRVGMVTGLTMGHALGVPVHGLCSLDALAAQAMYAGFNEERLLVATDARRKEVYWAAYDIRPSDDSNVITHGPRREAVRVDGPSVARPADLDADLRDLATVGRGPHLYPELLKAGPGILDVDAGILGVTASFRLARGESLPVEALYLRRPDALTTAERAQR